MTPRFQAFAHRRKGSAEDTLWRRPCLSLPWCRSSLRSPAQFPPTLHWPNWVVWSSPQQERLGNILFSWAYCLFQQGRILLVGKKGNRYWIVKDRVLSPAFRCCLLLHKITVKLELQSGCLFNPPQPTAAHHVFHFPSSCHEITLIDSLRDWRNL